MEETTRPICAELIDRRKYRQPDCRFLQRQLAGSRLGNEYGWIRARYWPPPRGGERQCDPHVTPMIDPTRAVATRAHRSMSAPSAPASAADCAATMICPSRF